MPIGINELRGDPDSNSDQSSDSEQDVPGPNHQAVNYSQSAAKRQAIENIIAEINAKLEEGAQVDLAEYPTLYVVHFRGVHFFNQYFSPQARRAIREEIKDDASVFNDKNIYSPAVYEMAGLRIGEPIDTKEKRQRIKEASVELNRRFDKLEGSKAGKPWWPEKDKIAFPSLLFQHYQRFVNEYAQFREESAARRYACYKIMDVDANPYIPTADGAKHAILYALGGKAELSHGTLRPNYNDTASGPRPKHPKTGYVQIFFHTLTSLKRNKPIFLSAAHANNDVAINTRQLNERETTFKAQISSRHIFHSEVVRFPSFNRPYRANYHSAKYGITTSNAYSRYKNSIDTTKGKAEKTGLLDNIAEHYAEQLLQKAQELAEINGGYIVYLGLDGSLQLHLPPTTDISYERKNKKKNCSHQSFLQAYYNSETQSDSDDDSDDEVDIRDITKVLGATTLTDEQSSQAVAVSSAATNSTTAVPSESNVAANHSPKLFKLPGKGRYILSTSAPVAEQSTSVENTASTASTSSTVAQPKTVIDGLKRTKNKKN